MGCNWLFSRVDVISFKYRIANKSPTPTPHPHQKKKTEKKGKHKAYTFFPRRTCIYNLFTLMSHLICHTMLCN